MLPLPKSGYAFPADLSQGITASEYEVLITIASELTFSYASMIFLVNLMDNGDHIPYALTFFHEILPYLSPAYARLLFTIISGENASIAFSIEATSLRSTSGITVILLLF